MDRVKQIEEMSYSVCNMDNKPKNCADCVWKNTCNPYLSAEQYYNAGYRKMEEVTLKLDLGDRTHEEIERITEQLSEAMSKTPPVVSLTDNEIRKQTVMEFAEKLKEEINNKRISVRGYKAEDYTEVTLKTGMVSAFDRCEELIDSLIKEKYAK